MIKINYLLYDWYHCIIVYIYAICTYVGMLITMYSIHLTLEMFYFNFILPWNFHLVLVKRKAWYSRTRFCYFLSILLLCGVSQLYSICIIYINNIMPVVPRGVCRWCFFLIHTLFVSYVVLPIY